MEVEVSPGDGGGGGEGGEPGLGGEDHQAYKAQDQVDGHHEHPDSEGVGNLTFKHCQSGNKKYFHS